MAKKPTPKLTVEALKHDAATRKNIPTAEIGENALAVLDNDIFSPFDKSSKVGAGDTASEVLNGYISYPFDMQKSGRITVKVIKRLGDEVMDVFRIA